MGGARKLFGTDGIRGKAGVPPMTADTAQAVGRAVAEVCRQGHDPMVAIGRDTRVSGNMLETALSAGIRAMGVDAGLLGVLPTPGIAFAVRKLGAVAGVVISASHNPFDDNGIKVFSSTGQKLDDDMESRVETLVLGPQSPAGKPARTGKTRDLAGTAADYCAFCRASVPPEITFKGLRVVLDCANGAAFQVAPEVFKAMGAEVAVINAAPDGTNINRDCGSQHTGGLVRAVRETRADAGLAFDGDADRLIAVDETGRELDGDAILAVCARDLLDRGALRNRTVVATQMSNLGLRLAMAGMGVRLLDAAVGDRHVLELMQKNGACLGGEQSGHVIFLGHHTTGDGIISGLQLLAAVRRSGRKLSELAAIFRPAPQRLINVDVRDKPPLETIDSVRSAIRAAQEELGDSGRVLVRYSGTQMMCRVMVEAPDAATTNRVAERVADAVRAVLG
jgi:phosphoglucosamine mutase